MAMKVFERRMVRRYLTLSWLRNPVLLSVKYIVEPSGDSMILSTVWSPSGWAMSDTSPVTRSTLLVVDRLVAREVRLEQRRLECDQPDERVGGQGELAIGGIVLKAPDVNRASISRDDVVSTISVDITDDRIGAVGIRIGITLYQQG